MTDILDLSFDDFLAHHGVKGMKWGVRKGEDGFGTIESGKGWKINTDGSVEIDQTATISRIVRNHKALMGGTGAAFDSGAPVYAAFKPSDIAGYQHFFGRPQSLLVKEASSKQVFSPTTKLKAPGPKEAAEIYFEMFNKNPQLKQDMNDGLVGGLARKSFAKALADPSSEHAYGLYTMGLDSANYNKKTKHINEAYFKEVKKRGYNMLVDASDASTDFDTPIMILDGKKNLKLKSEVILDKVAQKQARELYNSLNAQRGKTYLQNLGYDV